MMKDIGNSHFEELIEWFPGGVMILDSKMRIEYFNKEMKEILGINSEKKIGEEFSRVFSEFSNGKLRYKRNKGETVVLRGKIQKIEDMYLGCFVDVSDLDKYWELLDKVPVGVYEVDEGYNITMANEGFARIFGYNSAKDVTAISARELFLSDEEMEKFIETLREKGSVMNYILDMKRKDGKKIIVSASNSLMRNNDGSQTRNEGTLLDVTEKMEYLKALAEMPTGYYEVEHKPNAKDEIIECNEAFVELLGFRMDEIIGMNISNLYSNPDEEKKFLQKLRERSMKNRDLKDYEIKIKRKDGTEFYAEIDCHLIKDARGEEVGRRGTIRDITHKILLIKTLEDMDRFVHQYITPLINIEISTEAMVKLLELITGLKYQRVILLNPSERITDEFVAMIENSISLFGKTDIPPNISEDIEYHLDEIRRRKELFSSDSSLMDMWTREHLFHILDKLHYISDVLKPGMPENVSNRIKKIQEKGQYILQIYAMQQQQMIYSTAKLTHNVLESLRFYLFKGRERDFDYRMTNVYSIIKKNMELLYPHAQLKGLHFTYKGEKDIKALIAVEHFDRAIFNLLMNAIKYSYTREGGYIDVIAEDSGEEVKVEISNYGVPIRKDEIHKVFDYGYRGVFSPDWNRMGSGIGLADAKSVVEKHGGRVEIMSVPSQPGHFGLYDIPYITKVSIQIPKRRGD